MTDMKAAEAIADKIRAETRGLDYEDKMAVTEGRKNHARAKKYREQDRAQINGYRIALSYVLGCPLDFHKTDAFIDQKDYCSCASMASATTSALSKRSSVARPS